MAYNKNKKAFLNKRKVCQFCENKQTYIDYKDTETLTKFISGTGQIKSKSLTGTCAKHQRKLATAIKRARFIALLPFTIVRTRFSSK
ncbi:30S ribosomal protein S18 [Mycoplasmopsis bovirhinis]|uniref:Small ribosomal subunit protein bS18 n=1 Tax=Mycoplasmopsis bovirhinis TaxID=29553 RepID=A0A449AD14_9BACT|nr:30S ribosomal protein S18 [Mycoplasmopsis bovirhinis]VEU62863.1 30S ribosomal protein S18 [Mycoplasmopsis bovirhinis]